MLRNLPTVLTALTSVAFTGAAAGSDEFFFRKGDRVLFLGDSITEQYQYSTYIELYLTTRFPDWGFVFLNSGISGDRAVGGAGRFKTHVLAEKPTALTINFGMNDGAYGGFNPVLNAEYVKKTEEMLAAAQKAGVRVALLSPNAVDRRANPALSTYFETQKQFYAPLKELAGKYGDSFVDQYAITRAVLEKREADKAAAVRPFPDGVHTSSSGGLLMAHTILVGLHAPALVSRATVDAASGSAQGDRCAISNVAASGGAVAFDRRDESLPFPVQKDWLPLLPYVNDLRDFNDYRLTVTSLATGKYSVKVDGVVMGAFTNVELAAGVNLGNAVFGPIHDQAMKVFKAIDAKNKRVHERFRSVVMSRPAAQYSQIEGELQRRMAEIQKMQERIYADAKPVSRRFEISPAN